MNVELLYPLAINSPVCQLEIKMTAQVSYTQVCMFGSVRQLSVVFASENIRNLKVRRSSEMNAKCHINPHVQKLT